MSERYDKEKRKADFVRFEQLARCGANHIGSDTVSIILHARATSAEVLLT